MFLELTEAALINALEQAYQLFGEQSPQMSEIRERCMREDFSWENSARSYSLAYTQAVHEKLGVGLPNEALAPRN